MKYVHLTVAHSKGQGQILAHSKGQGQILAYSKGQGKIQTYFDSKYLINSDNYIEGTFQ